jgi:hypothetical protein
MKKRLSSGLRAPVVAAVVLTVRVAVAADTPVMFTDIGAIVHVGGAVGLVKAVATAQLRLTVPVKPPNGVIVMVAVFPVVAPGATVMPPLLLNAKPGLDAWVTLTSADPVELL